MGGNGKVETFHVTTFGCQMNLADSSTLVANLLTRGYRRVADETEADLIILNTCSVREKAEERVLGRLGDLLRFKKDRPYLKIAVVGCMAQRMGEDLRERAPHVDYVLGTDRLFELPDVLEGRDGTSRIMTAFGHEDFDHLQPERENEFSGFVTIARGCDNYCAYCIVPYVRGQEHCHSVSHIVESINRLVREGAAEVTLLGQNVNSYRFGETDFPRLLEIVVRETSVPRLRFMTSHPKDLSERLVEVMAANSRIMPHIHLPLQSGSDRILSRMGRRYSWDHYRLIVETIRRHLPYVVLTTDLMVGFPGELLDEYQMTLDAVREVQFDSAFMFRYSVRPGTRAAKLVDDVPEAEKIRRLNGLISLQQEISKERNQREVGQVRHSLVEGASRRSEEFVRARTEGNKTVLLAGESLRAGQVVPVRITSADAFTLHGELVETD